MPAKIAKKGTAKKAVAKKTVTASSLDSKVYAACDIMRRSNCSGAMNYIPELSWILFLRILDELEILEEKRLQPSACRSLHRCKAPFAGGIGRPNHPMGMPAAQDWAGNAAS